jgi:hypothetical protein
VLPGFWNREHINEKPTRSGPFRILKLHQGVLLGTSKFLLFGRARRKATAVDKKLVEGMSPRGLTCHCTDKPDIFTLPRCKSSGLFYSCYESAVALALANCNEHVAEENITAPAHTQRALHGAQSSRGKGGKITFIPFGIHGRVPSAFPVSRAKLPHRVFYFSSLLPAPFLPRDPHLQVASSHEIFHMQAGQ